MKVVTKLYLTQEENDKIEVMVYDIDDLLVKMEKHGISDRSNSAAYNHLVNAQDELQLFLDEVEGLDEEEKEW